MESPTFPQALLVASGMLGENGVRPDMMRRTAMSTFCCGVSGIGASTSLQHCCVLPERFSATEQSSPELDAQAWTDPLVA